MLDWSWGGLFFNSATLYPHAHRVPCIAHLCNHNDPSGIADWDGKNPFIYLLEVVMKLHRLALALTALLISNNCIAVGEIKDSNWLIGTWTLCEDPDNSPKDSLQFNQDGSGLLIRVKGNIEFLHKHTAEKVHLLANANGRAIPIEFAVSADHDKLLLHSDKTGNTSTYVRTDSKLVKQCTLN